VAKNLQNPRDYAPLSLLVRNTDLAHMHFFVTSYFTCGLDDQPLSNTYNQQVISYEFPFTSFIKARSGMQLFILK